MMMGRTGKLNVGMLLIVAAVVVMVYYGYAFGSAYWRRYELEEAVVQRLAYAGQLTEDAIHQEILEDIAAMHLPREASRVQFIRLDRPRALQVRISYSETVNLVFTKVRLPMSVEVRRAF